MQRLTFKAAAGERVYAVGDVHGCWELTAQLLATIRADNDRRGPAKTRIILIGDVVDRGPATQEVLSHLTRYTRASERFVVLMGNHEQLMWSALGGDLSALADWMAVGGAATLASFGVPAALLAAPYGKRLLEAARKRIAPELALWLERLPLTASSGDLVFVHAGVRPGVVLSAQTPRDLLWIREPFLDSDEDRPFFVVHGHTVTIDGVEVRPNRMGVDTGAHLTGRLTAAGFEGSDWWELSTRGSTRSARA